MTWGKEDVPPARRDEERDGWCGNCGQRVIRGGAWTDDLPVFLRSSNRHRDTTVSRLNYLGFRLAQDIP
ncbi:SUMF1/EgtB/PvdO family nonheme iron enzyme [Candidatus Nitrospira neomarina]|uniref:SUMF1/EgtB/PvdO family nonheme iron enzyme n=1 Tax=Candidatus Nitrospira neomarina TaxID=3020899 RepID=UPI0035E3E4F9